VRSCRNFCTNFNEILISSCPGDDNDKIRQLGDVTPPTPTPTPTVIVPEGDKWLVFDGHAWIVYDISKLDESYHHHNQHEEFHIRFQTDQPDGLLWYNGNDTNNVHLSINVRTTTFTFSFSSDFWTRKSGPKTLLMLLLLLLSVR